MRISSTSVCGTPSASIHHVLDRRGARTGSFELPLAQCRREEVVQLFVEAESCGDHWTSIAPRARVPAPRPGSPPRSHSHLCSGRNEALAESRTPAINGHSSAPFFGRSGGGSVQQAAIRFATTHVASLAVRYPEGVDAANVCFLV